MMYPWKSVLSDWAAGTNLKIDALGLVTMLGSNEMDESIGRLVSSPFLQFLPLLGAFVVAGDRFTERRPGYTLYSISSGILTTEVAGWFYRWVKSQRFETVRTRIEWEVGLRPPRWRAYLAGFLLVGLPLNGMLVAMTILSDDWWGFANAISMVVSIVVKMLVVHMNSRAIDANIATAKTSLDNMVRKYKNDAEEFQRAQRDYENQLRMRRDTQERGDIGMIEPVLKPVRPIDPEAPAKLLVITDDSRAISMRASEYLVKHLFAANPTPAPKKLYDFARMVGWAAFAVHVLSLGMAALHTQIYTVVLLVVATVLTRSQVGCEDFGIGRAKTVRSCWVSSTLKATVSKYPLEYKNMSSEWTHEDSPDVLVDDGQWPVKGDEEQNASETGASTIATRASTAVPRRQDLYVWLDLNDEEEESMKAWNLLPRNPFWLKEYDAKKTEHWERLRRRKEAGRCRRSP